MLVVSWRTRVREEEVLPSWRTRLLNRFRAGFTVIFTMGLE